MEGDVAGRAGDAAGLGDRISGADGATGLCGGRIKDAAGLRTLSAAGGATGWPPGGRVGLRGTSRRSVAVSRRA